MKIIEFCGNPGVGKSTLVTALTKEMRHRGIRTICYIPGTKAGLDYCLLASKLIYKYYEYCFPKRAVLNFHTKNTMIVYRNICMSIHCVGRYCV